MGWVVRVFPQWGGYGGGCGARLGRPGGPMACWVVAQWGEGGFLFFFLFCFLFLFFFHFLFYLF